jgi:L-fuconolactonase
MPATSSSSAPVPPHYLPVRQAWLDRRKEPILDAKMPIVDAHHHLWDRPGWRYLLDDLLDDTNSGHNIVATVFVGGRSVGEVEFVNGVAAMSASGTYGKTRACACIVGHADLTLGSRVEPILVALARAGGDRFRGIRHITTWDADSSVVNPAYVTRQHMMAEASFREGFAVLGRLDLSFDACLFHPQIDELTSLAHTFPDVRIVLNHVGDPIAVLTPVGATRCLPTGRLRSNGSAPAKTSM